METVLLYSDDHYKDVEDTILEKIGCPIEVEKFLDKDKEIAIWIESNYDEIERYLSILIDEDDLLYIFIDIKDENIIKLINGEISLQDVFEKYGEYLFKIHKINEERAAITRVNKDILDKINKYQELIKKDDLKLLDIGDDYTTKINHPVWLDYPSVFSSPLLREKQLCKFGDYLHVCYSNTWTKRGTRYLCMLIENTMNVLIGTITTEELIQIIDGELSIKQFFNDECMEHRLYLIEMDSNSNAVPKKINIYELKSQEWFNQLDETIKYPPENLQEYREFLLRECKRLNKERIQYYEEQEEFDRELDDLAQKELDEIE